MTDSPHTPAESPVERPIGPKAIGALVAALAAAQAELPVVPKSKTAVVRTRDGGSYTYSYADLSDVAAAAYAVMSKHGLAFTTWPGYDEGGRYVLHGALLHVSGQQVRGVFPLPAEASGPQVLGSALSYGRRYLLGCLLGVVTEADDDAQAAAASTGTRAGRPSGRARGKPPDPPEDSPLLNTSSKLAKRLYATLGELLGHDRDGWLTFCSQTIDRLVESSSELTDAETHVIIAAAERELEHQRERADHEGESAAGEVAGDA